MNKSTRDTQPVIDRSVLNQICKSIVKFSGLFFAGMLLMFVPII